MPSDANRSTLRSTLTWLSLGLVLLGLSIGLPALGTLDWLSSLAQSLHLALAGKLLGLAGAAGCLAAFVRLARTRVDGRVSLWLVCGSLLWASEFVLRLASFSTAVASPLALRILFAGIAMHCLCAGVPWVLDLGGVRARARSWVVSRRLFSLQLAVFLFAPFTAWLRNRPVLEDPVGETLLVLPLGFVLAWTLFLAPYAHLLWSARRTLKWVSRPQTLSDILRASG
jgi:hypothetical protein